MAFRLYKEETFQSLPAATVPEIQRVSLTSLMLQLKQLNVQQPQDFDFLDRCALDHAKHSSKVFERAGKIWGMQDYHMTVCRPSTSAMLRALESLLALGALDSEGALTPLGRQMVRLPVDPVFAKVCVSFECCAQDVLANCCLVRKATDTAYLSL